jgi:heterogeneous nuclear ribonucleoprotein A1/A3
MKLMSNKLFVGGLSGATTDTSLRAAFERCGIVLEARVALDTATGASRGFGTVTLASAGSARNALEMLDGSAIDGAAVSVNGSNPRLPRRRWW